MKTFKIIAALCVAATLNPARAQNLQTGLQACYPLDCDVNNYAATGGGLNGTPVSVACTTGVNNVANTAYAFSGGTGSYIQLPNSSLIKPTNFISFSGWVRFDVNTASQMIVFAQNSCPSYFEGYALAASYNGTNMRLAVVKSSSGCSSGTQHVLTGSTPLSTGTWYHVGFYAGTDSLKLFLDGLPQGSMVSTTAFNYANTNVYLGGTNSGIANAPLDGSLDNVRFYNRKLTNGEFYQLYATNPACNVQGGPLLTDNLQACYRLDCNGTDSGPLNNNLHGTLFNISCCTDRFGNTSGACAFGNSTSSYIQLPNNSLIKPTSALSISGWVKFNSTTNSQIIAFTKNTCSQYFEGYALAASKIGGNMRLQVVKSGNPNCNSSTQHVITGGTNLSSGTWYHVGCYIGTDSIKLFLNGNPEGTPMVSTQAFNYDSNKNVYLGGTNEGSFNLPLDGCLDEFRFYNRKVYNYEFKNLYNAPPPTCTAAGPGLLNGLQACYPLNCNGVNFAPTANTPPSLDAVTLSNVTCDTGHVGNLNGAYKFSGNTNSYIQLPNDARLKPNAITVSCWVKIDVLKTHQYLVFARNPCTIYFEGYTLLASSVGGGNFRFSVAKSPGGNPCTAGTSLNSTLSNYVVNTWYHVVFYIDGSVMKMWVNGSAAGSTAAVQNINYGNTNVYLGNTNESYNWPLEGSMDNVRFYDRELSGTEIILLGYDPGCDVVNPCAGDPNPCRTASTETGIEKNAPVNKNRIELYPNPNTGKFFLTNAKGKSVAVYDINGRAVQYSMQQVDDNTGEISLNAANGIYLIKITNADGSLLQTSKVILSK